VARTWLSIRVDLVEGMHAHELWPRPGRILLARPGMTFRMLADAINDAFARWDRSHLHAFTLAEGTRISIRGPWDESDDDDELDDTRTTLSRLKLGEQFTFEFDFGDSWMHLCTVAEQKVDPHEVYGEAPDRPVPYWGWGWIPDQYGRRWDGDDGESPLPPPPDPPLSDLPDLHYTWGSRAFSSPPQQRGEAVEGDGHLVVGPWGDNADDLRRPTAGPWPYDAMQDLRRAVAHRDVVQVVELMVQHDALEVAHVVGPGLIRAVEVGHDPATVVVAELVPRLEDRGWLGDAELAEELDRVANGEAGELRPAAVGLEELASHLEGPTDFDEGWMLEIATGRLWPRDPVAMAGVDEPEDFDDPDAFVAVVGFGSRPGYDDVRDFIGAVTDDALAGRLGVAIQGKGAFRRFKDMLFPHEDWWGAWLTFSNERQLGRARWWLADAGLRPATATDDQDEV
jgi:hypothetical protein